VVESAEARLSPKISVEVVKTTQSSHPNSNLDGRNSYPNSNLDITCTAIGIDLVKLFIKTYIFYKCPSISEVRG
jgi:hypothetical protein